MSEINLYAMHCCFGDGDDNPTRSLIAISSDIEKLKALYEREHKKSINSTRSKKLDTRLFVLEEWPEDLRLDDAPDYEIVLLKENDGVWE